MFQNHPEIEVIKNNFYTMGCVYAAMSGSGSAVYGISYEKLNFKKAPANTNVWQGVLN